MDEKKYEKYSRAYQLIEQRYLRRQNGNFSLKKLGEDILNFFEYQFLPHYAASPPFWRLLLRHLKGNRSLPDFAIVGPIKSGSSDLVTHLLLHPCVIPPLAKEIYSMEPETWRPYYPTVDERKEVEAKHGKAVSGFLAPFMHSAHLINRFQAARPEAKIILLLRNPVDRAYSHWKWEVLLGGHLAQSVPFFQDFSLFVETAIKLFPENQIDSFCGFPFLESGIYFKSVKLWMDAFGADRVMVLDMAGYFRDRGQVLDQIQDFLELPNAEITGDREPINRNPLTRKSMDEATRNVLADFYRPYNEKLYALIGTNYDWRAGFTGIT